MKLKTFIILSFIIFSYLLSGSSKAEPRRVLLEFSTGVWCGYCPCGDSIITHHILNQYPQTIVLAYHGPANSASDPFSYFNGNDIISLIGYTAYPLAIFDRQSGAPMDFDYNWPDTCAVRYQRSPNSAISLVLTAKAYNTTTRVLTATLDATALQTLSGQYKITYVISENNIVYPHSSYALCGYNGTITNYVNNWVVRNIVNGATGENLNAGTWNQNQVITKQISTTIDASWVAENCNLVIFAYKDSTMLRAATVEQGALQSVTNPLGINGLPQIPSEFRLEQNYPNPFNPVTHIKYSVPKTGKVSLRVYDVLGNLVEILAEGNLSAGVYNAEFDGSALSSGIYFYTLEAPGFKETKKLSLIK